MGNGTWSSFADPPRQAPPDPRQGQKWSALQHLKGSRGAQWTPEVEGMVDYFLRTSWDSDPEPGETYQQWGSRMDAAFDAHKLGLERWINTPLSAPPTTGGGEQQAEATRAEAPGGWAAPRAAGGWGSSGHYVYAGDHRGRKDAHSWGRDYSGQAWEKSNWGDTQDQGPQEQSPRQQGNPWSCQGEEGTQGMSPEDPWGRWMQAKEQKRQEDRRQGWDDQQRETRAGRAETPASVPRWDRISPPWKVEWKAGRHHQEMRYGDWRCGNKPFCKFANFGWRDTCKKCGVSKDYAKWELPQDPGATTCLCRAQILPHFHGACRQCHAPIQRPE